MNLSPGDVVVVDANVLIMRKTSGRVCEKIISSRAHLAVSDKLLDECYRHVADAGWSPLAFKQLRLKRLEERGALIYKKDKDLRIIIPNHMPDHHVGNLAITVGAKVIVSLNEKHKPILEKYGLVVTNLTEFMNS